MQSYEIIFAARGDLAPKDVDAITDSYIEIVEAAGGSLVDIEYWGLRQLAYLMNKNSRGHYVKFQIKSDFTPVKEILRKISINENIIRHAYFKLDKISLETPAFLNVCKRAVDYVASSAKPLYAEKTSYLKSQSEFDIPTDIILQG